MIYQTFLLTWDVSEIDSYWVAQSNDIIVKADSFEELKEMMKIEDGAYQIYINNIDSEKEYDIYRNLF